MPGLFADDFIPPPRVRAEGANIYKKHQGTVQNLMLEVEGTSFGTEKKSYYKKPKDHVLENVRRMRQIQKSCKARVDESDEKEATPVKALWRSSKYANVPSKVAQFVTINFEARRPASARPASRERDTNVPERDGANEKRQSRRPNSARPASVDRPDIVPPLENFEDEKLANMKRMPRSFIRINALAASHAVPRRAPSATTLKENQQRQEDVLKTKYHVGEVPEYIIERKKQWQAEEAERIRNLPDPDQPPGHRLLPTDERKATLEKLQQRERELTTQLLKLPLKIDTPRMIRMKNDIEMQLSQVDEAMRVFSRNKVFVKCE